MTGAAEEGPGGAAPTGADGAAASTAGSAAAAGSTAAAPAAPHPPAPAERGGFLAFWSTLPGVLTGVAAVVAAVVSLLAVFGPGRGADAGGPVAAAPGPAGTSRPATGAPAGSLSPAGPGDGQTTDAQLVAEGTLELRESDYVDLATGTMSSSRDAGSDFFLIGGDGFFLDAAVGETLALAHGAGDRADCAETLPRRTDASISLRGVRPGAVVCVLTSDLEIAVLSLEKLPTVGSPVLRFGYRLWH